MKEIGLTQGYAALVDDDDYEELSRFRWFATTRNTTVYAARDASRGDDEGPRRIYMHRQIMGAPATLQVDHVNGNGIDNRRENLRFATPKQNAQNRTAPCRSSTGFRGVREVSPGSFAAYLNCNGAQTHLGCWGTAEEAATARDFAVIDARSLARLNFESPPFSRDTLAVSRQEQTRTSTPGVRFKRGAWEAWGRRGGRKVYLGRFATQDEAVAARSTIVAD